MAVNYSTQPVQLKPSSRLLDSICCFMQFKADAVLSDDPAQLLDQLIALGDMARQISHALGGNGHRSEQAAQLIEELAKR